MREGRETSALAFMVFYLLSNNVLAVFGIRCIQYADL